MPENMEPPDDLLHNAEIKLDILKNHQLKPSVDLKKYIQKEAIDEKLPKRFRLIMAMEEVMDSLKKGAMSKPVDIKCGNELIKIDSLNDSFQDFLQQIYGVVLADRIREIRIKVHHKRFSDITAAVKIAEKQKNEYRLNISFNGDIKKSELMSIMNSLEKKFPKKDSAGYRQLKYSSGSFSGSDKATLLLLGPGSVMIKRSLEKVGKKLKNKTRK